MKTGIFAWMLILLMNGLVHDDLNERLHICIFVSFQRGSDELMSQSPMVTTNGTGISPGQNEINDAKKVSKHLMQYTHLYHPFQL